jgi:hypothetical protein
MSPTASALLDSSAYQSTPTGDSFIVIFVRRDDDLVLQRAECLIRNLAWRILTLHKFLQPVQPVGSPLGRVRYQANFVGQLGFEFLEPRPRFDLRNGSDTPVLYPLGAKPRLAALLRFKRGPLQFGDAHFDILILDAFDGKIKNALGGSEPDGGGHALIRHQF